MSLPEVRSSNDAVAGPGSDLQLPDRAPAKKQLSRGGSVAKRANMKFLSRSILLEESGPPGMLRHTIMVGSFLVLAFLGWAALLELDEMASAPGEVLPVNSIQPVQHLEGGIVADIFVKNGDAVRAGDPVLILDNTAFLSDLKRVRARYAALDFQMRRLRAFALGEEVSFDVDGETEDLSAEASFDETDLAAAQLEILSTQIKARDAQIAVIESQIDERRNALKGLVGQESMLQRQVAIVKEELELRQKLLDKGLTSKLVFLSTKRELNRTEGELESVRSQQSSARAMLAQAESSLLELESRLRNDALDEMGRLSGQLAETSKELTQLEDRVRRLSVKSPVDGVIKGLAVSAIGQVIEPGAQVAEVVPQRSEMVAEVRIQPRDIGFIKEGTPALVKVSTYDFARFGGIEGKVQQVSAASFLDEQGQPYFRGRVVLDQNFVGRRADGAIVTPGMTLTADIKTGQKSLLGYLIRPVYNALHQGFSER
ncbi:MAG: HlyD family type I secretion periplasmic adaptor subunit [Pseudomonadota bacterium]